MEVRGQPGRWDIAWQACGGQETILQLAASFIQGSLCSVPAPALRHWDPRGCGVSSPGLERGGPGACPTAPWLALSPLSPHTSPSRLLSEAESLLINAAPVGRLRKACRSWEELVDIRHWEKDGPAREQGGGGGRSPIPHRTKRFLSPLHQLLSPQPRLDHFSNCNKLAFSGAGKPHGEA